MLLKRRIIFQPRDAAGLALLLLKYITLARTHVGDLLGESLLLQDELDPGEEIRAQTNKQIDKWTKWIKDLEAVRRTAKTDACQQRKQSKE